MIGTKQEEETKGLIDFLRGLDAVALSRVADALNIQLAPSKKRKPDVFYRSSILEWFACTICLRCYRTVATLFCCGSLWAWLLVHNRPLHNIPEGCW